MTFGDFIAVYKVQSQACNLLKPTSKLYRREVIEGILKSWPGIAILRKRKLLCGEIQ